ncbi:GNAT family N-acetyltransferase [Kibdelosporangium phytohabitans]|uniref:GNAT family N-acetyltransferase n=1 Tax=Kibdelosporangium phytohabitans TaxID=860235 RepID=UPI001A0E0619|nr:GNAT family N-acetyltransferase [Kibdelosporangium phytohabitans]MBE1463301.1 RimJ/RimL family protein N-acetyltransferase [Kibdelosporangium phytohabitans]
MPDVTLTPLDEESLVRLLVAAVADADPLEVMPPVDGPDGWTDRRRDAFLAFHRHRTLDPATAVERTWVIDVDGAAAGAARLERHGDDVEAGIWLGRTRRGQGVGKRVMQLLLDAAKQGGAARFVASTTADNHSARSLLDGLGAAMTVNQDEVFAALPLSG